jgi:putative ABC transport system ATP-binding protein
MATPAHPIPDESSRQRQADDALTILEEFSTAAQLRFDRTLAARGLGEAERVIPGNDFESCSRRLVEVGESIDLRVQSLFCSLDEALAFVQQGMPVAACVERPDWPVRWILVCAYA